ncbi:MAG: hypothetical protein ACK52U_01445 [Synechococcaceae cyanobacterium]|jgi:hypothetical protein
MSRRAAGDRLQHRLLQGAVALVSGLGSMAAPSARAADPGDWPALVAMFAQRGLKVVFDAPRCQERDLFGFYERSQRRIVVCPRGNRRETLLHEGWHGVQSLCLRGRPLLPKEVLDRGLTARDRRDLDRLYGPSGWNREAEARVMASLPLPAYRTWLEAACGPLDEPGTTAPAQGAQSPGSSPPPAGPGSGRGTSAAGGGP